MEEEILFHMKLTIVNEMCTIVNPKRTQRRASKVDEDMWSLS